MLARKQRRLAGMMGVIAGIGMAGPALAADVYRACADVNNRQIRPSSILVNATPLCTSKENVHLWNQTGPQGAQGLPGPAGPSAVYTKIGQPLVPLPVNPDGTVQGEVWTEVGTIDLPGGNYAITATANRIYNNALTEVERTEVRCFLNTVDGTQLAGVVASHASLGPRQVAALTVTAVAISPLPKTYRLVCTNRTTVGDVGVGEFSFMAIKVGAVHYP
jgi:hypothetical protein